MRTHRASTALLAAGFAASLVGLTAAPGAAAVIDRKASLLATARTSLGTIVVDAKGRTVYEFAADSKGHSACTGACLKAWPAVAAPAKLPSSVPGISGKVGVLKRPDGIRQLTLNGFPLYTFAGDSSAGTTAGQGVNASGGRWWVVTPAGARITTTPNASTPTTPTEPGPGYDY